MQSISLLYEGKPNRIWCTEWLHNDKVDEPDNLTLEHQYHNFASFQPLEPLLAISDIFERINIP
jgi:hypothetical protein